MSHGARALFVTALLLTVLMPLGPASAADPDYFVTSTGGSPLPLEPDATTLFLSNDMVTSGIPLGFSTTFFERSASEFWVGSNGFVTLHFITPPGCCEGSPIPRSGDGGPDGFIAGWWTDLDPSAGGTVRFDRTNVEGQAALIVDYAAVPVLGTSGNASFQIVILQNGVFEVRISGAVSAPGRNVTVGAENINGTRGIQALHQAGGNATDIGFRFTPNIPPVPPPVIHEISPPFGAPGNGIRVVGENFAPGAQVSVGGAPAFTFVDSREVLFFSVPSLPSGFHNLTVRNPDGNETTEVGGFEVMDQFAFFGMSSSSARQGDRVSFHGSAFDDNVTFFIGSAPMEVDLLTRTAAFVTVPTRFPPGLYSVGVFDPARGRFEQRDAFLVLGRPDLAVVDVEVDRPEISTFATPGIPTPQPWTVTVTVRNAGDLTARSAMIELDVTPTGSGPRHQAVAPLGDVRPGETRREVFVIGSGFELGDHSFRANASSSGDVVDRDLTNNERTVMHGAYVSGVSGTTLDPCFHAPRACMTPQTVSHKVDERDQTDTHGSAKASLHALMRTPDFDFDRFTMVFTNVESFLDGGFRECTTWRFLDDRDGTFRVTMDAANGLSGLLDIPLAQARESNGTQRTTRYEDTRAFGVILAETERNATSSQPSEPLAQYEFSADPVAQWSLRATGLSGDFTHCAFRPAVGDPSDEFTFAALPSDTSVPVANLEGRGSADTIVVDFLGQTHSQTSRPFP